MDGEVASGEGGQTLVVETEPVGGHVAGHPHHPPVAHVVEALTLPTAHGRGVVGVGGPESPEGVVAEDVAFDPVLGTSPPGPDDENELAVGDGPQQTLDERGAEEPRGAGDGDACLAQLLPNHGPVLAPPSTNW